MRQWIDLVEKIVFRDPVRLNAGDWLTTVVAINPSKLEFWSANFRQTKTDELAETPSAAGVILKDGTIVVGEGHGLSHEEICDCAGLDINQEVFRLQIHDNKVRVEIWLPDEVSNTAPTAEKIAAAEQLTGLKIEQIKAQVAEKTNRFVPGWPVTCLLWTQYSTSEEV